MNTFLRNDPVLFQGEPFTVKFVDGDDVLIENESHRLRVHYLTVTRNPWEN